MPFGLASAPATFERLMERVLAGLQWKSCLVYLDDVIVFGDSFETHFSRLCLILDYLEFLLILKAKGIYSKNRLIRLQNVQRGKYPLSLWCERPAGNCGGFDRILLRWEWG